MDTTDTWNCTIPIDIRIWIYVDVWKFLVIKQTPSLLTIIYTAKGGGIETRTEERTDWPERLTSNSNIGKWHVLQFLERENWLSRNLRLVLLFYCFVACRPQISKTQQISFFLSLLLEAQHHYWSIYILQRRKYIWCPCIRTIFHWWEVMCHNSIISNKWKSLSTYHHPINLY